MKTVSLKTVEDAAAKCGGCGHRWVPRKPDPPWKCPRCQAQCVTRKTLPALQAECERCGRAWFPPRQFGKGFRPPVSCDLCFSSPAQKNTAAARVTKSRSGRWARVGHATARLATGAEGEEVLVARAGGYEFKALAGEVLAALEREEKRVAEAVEAGRGRVATGYKESARVEDAALALFAAKSVALAAGLGAGQAGRGAELAARCPSCGHAWVPRARRWPKNCSRCRARLPRPLVECFSCKRVYRPYNPLRAWLGRCGYCGSRKIVFLKEGGAGAATARAP